MSDRDEHGWTQEQHDDRQAAWRLDLGDDLELLDDHDHVRIGDRFGSVLCYTDEQRSSGSRYHFVDVGPWLPPEQRPTGVRPQWTDDAWAGPEPEDWQTRPLDHEEYALYCNEQDDHDRARGTQVLRVAMQAAHREMRPRLLEMRQWLAEQPETPVATLTVRCDSLRSSRRCRQVLATLWETPYGIYGVSTVVPSRTADHAITTYGDPEDSAFAGKEISHEFAPEDVDVGVDDFIPMACRDHGNAFVGAALLVAEAHSTRRTLNVDTMNAKQFR